MTDFGRRELATRALGRRCVACNQPATASAWLCSDCAFVSLYYTARFKNDVRAPTATTISKYRSWYSPDEYNNVPVLPPLDEIERFALIRKRVESEQPDQQQSYLDQLKQDARGYTTLARRVDINKQKRLCSADFIPDHWNYVTPLDPRRWCEDCLGCRVHRRGCPLIDLDGPFVGGYPNDGLLQQAPRKYLAPLQTPTKFWTPSQRRQHDRAVARRWKIFAECWNRIGLDLFTKALQRANARSAIRRARKQRQSISHPAQGVQ